ncbi:MAG: class I SAM-dependent methyltransferase [Crocosphaera sp.]
MNQKLIWDYFQDEGSESFSGSIPRLRFLVNHAQKIITDSKSKDINVLNIGVGNGSLENFCQQKGWDTYSLDPSEVAIKKLAANGGKGKTGIIEKIPYDDNTFDIVFCSEVLEHLLDEQLDIGLKEINRVLVKGGYLVGTVPFNENLLANKVVCPNCGNRFHKWGHHQSFDVERLQSIFSLNFKTETIKVIYFVSWSSLNWKGKLVSIIKKILSIFGLHGSNENIFFATRKFL